MPNRNYRRGYENERKTMRVLEAAGYETFRMAGSHGMFDVIAVGKNDVRLIQVKSGRARMGPAAREAMRAVKVPPNCTKEEWRWPRMARQPLIEIYL